MKHLLALLFAFSLLASKAQTIITTNQAKDHVGETVTICDKVTTTFYAEKSKGRPTFLNFGANYPNNIFDVVIWAEDDIMFSFKPKDLSGKNICVTVRIRLYKDKPEMVVKYSSQIKVE